MRKLLRLAIWVAVFSISAWWLSAGAVVIEGTTPSGKFKTVGLDEQGNFKVAVGTGTPYHVITDTGSVITTVVNPVEVKGNLAAVAVPVTGPGGGPVPTSTTFSGTVVVAASTSTSVTSAQVSIGIVAFTILSADATRKQSVLCNNDPNGLTVWIGDSGVTTATGIGLGAGGCMSPDVPTSYIGTLFGISSAATTGKIERISFH